MPAVRRVALCSMVSMCLLLALLPACREARMAVSPDLTAAAPAWPVSGRAVMGLESPVSFGPYRVTGVHRGWTERFGWGAVIYESLNASQEYEFRLEGPAPRPWQAQCAVNADQQFLKTALDKGRGEISWELSGQTNLVATFRELLGSQVWEMVLTRPSGRPVLNGYLAGGGRTIEVSGSRSLEGTSLPLTEAAGYEFRLDGRLMGAVQTMNDGVVWLDPAAPDEARQAMAVAAAGLLLFMDVSR